MNGSSSIHQEILRWATYCYWPTVADIPITCYEEAVEKDTCDNVESTFMNIEYKMWHPL